MRISSWVPLPACPAVLEHYSLDRAFVLDGVLHFPISDYYPRDPRNPRLRSIDRGLRGCARMEDMMEFEKSSYELPCREEHNQA